MMITIGKYKVKETPCGCIIYKGNAQIGGITGVKAQDLDEETIEELLFGDIEEEECWI
jgi:hypothetical protein